MSGRTHPEKTFIGRVARGFYFLGYWFSTRGLEVAEVTVERFMERLRRLYEQNATASRIEEYARRWLSWIRSGVLRVELGKEGLWARFTEVDIPHEDDATTPSRALPTSSYPLYPRLHTLFHGLLLP
ncbi:MAG: hypothetical protein F6J92_41055 [Symploca sp. SIO1A3]|nr:hypothetical protein [Symploca sp. SIO1A3]